VPKKKVKLPLSKTHPELAKEADGWNPSSYFYSDSIALSWKCKKGHMWLAKPASRTSKGLRTKTTGCPFCFGNLVNSGSDDLLSLNPILAKEADGWNPAKFSTGSNKKMDWKCKKGHTWKAVIYERAMRNSGCPYCKNTKVLSGFNDLKTLYPEIARQAYGWDTSQVNPGSHKKFKWKCKNNHIWEMPIVARTSEGQGCSVCANRIIISGVNDLSTMFPKIAEQADGWDPSQIGSGSRKKMKWRCKTGHSWKSSVGDMTTRNHLCPYCSNHNLLSGFNDLATKFPELANEAYGWNPTKIHFGSAKKLKWICSNGHTWSANVYSRTRLKSNCPSCTVGGFDPNLDSYLYFLQQKDWMMLQIGITNFPKDRINLHANWGWHLIELRGPMDGHLTQQWETAMLRMLKAKGADLSNSKIAGKFDGYSEAWSKSTFPVKSIKELMRLTDEFEEEQITLKLKK
jgi:hypothetical protein